MSQIYVTADTHFGHINVIPYCGRPFTDVDDMRQGLVDRWNGVIRKDDIVYVLGDVSLHPRELPVFSELNGTKRLIAGNHDKVWAGNKDSHKYFATYLEYFETIDVFRKIKFDGMSIMLSHFPYATNPATGRYTGYRLIDMGLPLLHGHVHERWKYNSSQKRTPMINAGVDVWDFRPVNLETVVEDFRDRRVFQVEPIEEGY